MGIEMSDYHKMRERLEKNRRLSPSYAELIRKTPGAMDHSINPMLKPHTANAAPGIRIRQDSKPLMNGLEQEWFNRLKASGAVENLSGQALRFKLANGAWYKIDVVGWVCGNLCAWEIKGGKGMKGIAKSTLTLKIAAQQWPQVKFFLCWKEAGLWREQTILP
jgi:hypothetical protein